MSIAVQSKKSLAAALHRTTRAGSSNGSTAAAKIGRGRKAARPLPLKNLAPLAARLAATDDDKEADSLRKQFLKGYYGKPVRLTNAKTAAV